MSRNSKRRRQKEQRASRAGNSLEGPPGQAANVRESPGWPGRHWVLSALLFAALLLAYYPALHGTPVWDDEHHLTRPDLRSWAGLARIWFDLGATQQYYPVTHSAFWLEHSLWGDWFTGYHLVNVILHTVSALLLVRILRRLEIRGAWLAGALWALHPVQVESVAWMSELKNTLSGVCYFGAGLLYLRFDRERSPKVYFAAFGLFIIGLFAKSVIDTLPAALLLIFYWKRGKLLWQRDVVPLIPVFVIGIAAGLVTASVERTLIGAEGDNFNFSLLERGLIAGRAFWLYLGKLVWPADLIFIYPRWEISASDWWQFLFPALALGFIAGLAWMCRRWGRGPMVAILYFAGTLFPALGFINIYPFRYSFVADHFQYLACAGPIVLFSAGVAWLSERTVKRYPLAMQGCCAILPAALMILTWRQCGTYSDIETLWRTTIAKNPECWMACNNLGMVLDQQGRLEEAVTEFREALRINPDYAKCHFNLGNALYQQGHAEEAMGEYRAASRINPAVADPHGNLGLVLSRQGRAEEAIAEFREALRLNPADGRVHFNLGMALLREGQMEAAMAEMEKALELLPGDPSIENQLAWTLATAPETSLRNGARAVELATEASRSSGQGNLAVLRTLAAAYAEAGQFPNAVQTAEKALQLAEDNENAALAGALRGDIKLYEAGQSFRALR
jgi:tetratricopeptide (TPR) repeat protein